MQRVWGLFFTVCFLSGFYGLNAQNINIKPLETVKQADVGEDKAQVDFISTSPDLSFTENSGAMVQEPIKRGDGRFVYTCICNVIDGNKFGFNISVTGGISMQELRVYIEEGELKEYIVEIEEIPVSIRDVTLKSSSPLIKEEHIAEVYINSNYNNLSVMSNTGEKVIGPTVNANHTFDYVVTFDLSTPESHDVERGLTFVAGKSSYPYPLGKLQPKQGQEIAVMVITEDFYTNEKNQIHQYFLNGNYVDAYRKLQKLLAKEGEESMPNMDADKVEIKRIERLAKARIHATHLFQKAEAFRVNQLDSAMYYHTEALKFRNFILKENPSDASCLEENRAYRIFMQHSPRIVSGRIINNIQLDRNGNNVPIGGVYIIVTAHKRDSENVNGVKVSKAGEIRNEITPLQFQSDEDGTFSVIVPRNTKETLYLLNFTANKDAVRRASDSYTYLPKDADVESNVVIKIDPRHRWWRSDEKNK